MQKQILYQLLDDEFTKFGDKFVKIAHNEANGMYCYTSKAKNLSENLVYKNYK